MWGLCSNNWLHSYYYVFSWGDIYFVEIISHFLQTIFATQALSHLSPWASIPGILTFWPIPGTNHHYLPHSPRHSSASRVSPVISGLSTLTQYHSPLLPLSETSHNLLTGLTPAFTIWDLPSCPSPPEALSQDMLNHSFYLSVPSDWKELSTKIKVEDQSTDPTGFKALLQSSHCFYVFNLSVSHLILHFLCLVWNMHSSYEGRKGRKRERDRGKEVEKKRRGDRE